MKRIMPIPTGVLFTDEYSKGELETLSIGDYGRALNVKADFLGHTRRIDSVPNVETMPLSEKWVITLSTQYGCKMACTFCDVPNVEFAGNATFTDLRDQLYSAINYFPKVKYTDRLNIHFARMGEPSFNTDNVFSFARVLGTTIGKQKLFDETGLRVEVIHPVFTTMAPKKLRYGFGSILQEWCEIKNEVFRGQAGLQLSINSTCSEQRREMFQNCALSIRALADRCHDLPVPLGRKYCLNFALASHFKVNAKYLAELFDPQQFMCKITPIHNNNACRANGIETTDGYSSYDAYHRVEQELIEAGFDVLVFIPSRDEEWGLVTCGNAVLGGSVPPEEES